MARPTNIPRLHVTTPRTPSPTPASETSPYSLAATIRNKLRLSDHTTPRHSANAAATSPANSRSANRRPSQDITQLRRPLSPLLPSRQSSHPSISPCSTWTDDSIPEPSPNHSTTPNLTTMPAPAPAPAPAALPLNPQPQPQPAPAPAAIPLNPPPAPQPALQPAPLNPPPNHPPQPHPHPHSHPPTTPQHPPPFLPLYPLGPITTGALHHLATFHHHLTCTRTAMGSPSYPVFLADLHDLTTNPTGMDTDRWARACEDCAAYWARVPMIHKPRLGRFYDHLPGSVEALVGGADPRDGIEDLMVRDAYTLEALRALYVADVYVQGCRAARRAGVGREDYEEAFLAEARRVCDLRWLRRAARVVEAREGDMKGWGLG